MHIVHSWQVIHRFDLPNRKGWFKHEKCICGKERIKEGLTLTANEADKNELGFALSMYSSFRKPESEDNK